MSQQMTSSSLMVGISPESSFWTPKPRRFVLMSTTKVEVTNTSIHLCCELMCGCGSGVVLCGASVMRRTSCVVVMYIYILSVRAQRV